MRKLTIICPICSRRKKIPIPFEIFNIDEGFLLKLPIQKGIVCNHKFIAIIDYHFKIRDYEILEKDEDFQEYQSKSKENRNPILFSSF